MHKNSKKTLKKVASHLREDIKGFNKETLGGKKIPKKMNKKKNFY